MRKLIAAALLALSLAACGTGTTSGTSTTDATEAPAATAPATTSQDSERLAHYRDIVKDMSCKELDAFEAQRLKIDFKDNGAALLVIHDRQAKLHCPF